jgi:8-amino-7-oxononanoate synthase
MSDWIHNELAAIAARGETRRLEAWSAPGPHLREGARPLLNLAGNDYLGLTQHPAVREAAARAARDIGPGATASRLLAGTCDLHNELEEQLAAWKGHPAALLFSSGYLAALGVIPVAAGRGDLVVADRLSHACLLDAARLSGAKLLRFKHNDLDDARRVLKARSTFQRCLLITESIFSMDGDRAPVAELLALAESNDALLLVDEAHALGAAGPRGAGLTADLRDERLISLGTLGKSLASAGGFVTSSRDLRELLINRARSFIFDTALPPPSVAAAQAALTLIQAHPEWPDALRQRASDFAAGLRAAGLPVLEGASHIVPILIGDSTRTMALARAVREKGVLSGAIRPPTVPPGTARLRLSLSLAHEPDELAAAAHLIARAWAEEGAHV